MARLYICGHCGRLRDTGQAYPCKGVRTCQTAEQEAAALGEKGGGA